MRPTAGTGLDDGKSSSTMTICMGRSSYLMGRTFKAVPARIGVRNSVHKQTCLGF